MSEQWAPVVGYEGIYEVSDQGRVRSLDRVSDVPGTGGVHRRLRGKQLKQIRERSGYLTVMLFRYGKPTRRRVHTLVCEAFVGPRPEGLVTRHLNGDPGDNRAVNLKWGTYVENGADMVSHGRSTRRTGPCPHGHEVSGANVLRIGKATACRACHYAGAKGVRRSDAHFQEKADAAYRRIREREQCLTTQ